MTQEFLDANASDPNTLGWMVGSPPPPDKLIRYADGTYYKFPQWRYTFSHWREFWPTVTVSRKGTPTRTLEVALRRDLDAVAFTPLNRTTPMRWAESLGANYTDGIVVLHRGRIVYEKYFGALTPERPHVAFSVTKSFFGTLAAILVAEGKLDREALVARYIPELANSGFGDATVGQVLDMTTAIDFTENYTEAAPPSMMAYSRSTGFASRNREAGPRSIYAFLATVGKQGVHGDAFTYRTPNTDVVGWLIARATGQSPTVVLSERLWSQLGAEDDGFLAVDDDGTPQAGLSLNVRLRDLARFGELMRCDGRANDRQIIPAAVVADIRRGASKEAFAKATYPTLPGWSYRNQWWVSHDAHDAFMARGIHGQAIYIDPTAEMVIARFASHPLAGNVNLDPTSLPAYRAIAAHLLTNR